MKPRILIALCGLMGLGCSAGPSDTVIVVSAASSLTYALQDLVDSYGELHPDAPTIQLNFGGTGALAQQIRQGAPVDLFIAANVAELDSLQSQGHVATHRFRFYGRLVMWCLDEAACPRSLPELAAPHIRRIAIAQPEVAPYGTAAISAFSAAGVLDALSPQLIQGQSARAALRYAETGDADVAMTALSLAQSVGGHWLPVDENLYAPIEQGMSLVTSTKEPQAAQDFFDFVAGPAGLRLLRAHGFRTPP